MKYIDGCFLSFNRQLPNGKRCLVGRIIVLGVGMSENIAKGLHSVNPEWKGSAQVGVNVRACKTLGRSNDGIWYRALARTR